MAFYPREDQGAKLYHCTICDGWYVKSMAVIYGSCLVMHPAGGCCHCFERNITEIKGKQMLDLLQTCPEKATEKPR